MARPLVGLQALEEPELGKKFKVDTKGEDSGTMADEGAELGQGETIMVAKVRSWGGERPA